MTRVLVTLGADARVERYGCSFRTIRVGQVALGIGRGHEKSCGGHDKSCGGHDKKHQGHEISILGHERSGRGHEICVWWHEIRYKAIKKGQKQSCGDCFCPFGSFADGRPDGAGALQAVAHAEGERAVLGTEVLVHLGESQVVARVDHHVHILVGDAHG